MNRTTEQIISDAEDTLYTAKLGMELVQGKDPKNRISGLRNVVVFGRAITNILQNLKSTLGEDFNNWYTPKVKEMSSDPVMKYFYKLRSEILKEGAVNTSSAVRLSGNPMALMQQYKSPPNTKGFFIGDSLGGCGWEVEIGPGITEKYYVDVPENIPGLQLNIDIHLLGSTEEISEYNIQELSSHYLDYLEKLVNEAKSKFI